MDIIDWNIIQRVSENESCSKIAAELSLSQPAVSYRIKQIEEQLGKKIFIKKNRSFFLNETGLSILPMVNRLVRDHHDIMNAVSTDVDALSGSITFGCPFVFASSYLPNILKDFTEIYPNLQLSIRVKMGRELMHLLENNDINAALIRDTDYVESGNGLVSVHLKEEPIYIASSQPITEEFLQGTNYIKCPISGALQSQLDSWWYEHYSEPPKTFVETDDATAGVNLLYGGVGWAFLSESRILKVKNKLHLQKIQLQSGEILTRKSSLVYVDDVENFTVLNAFVTFIQDYYKRNSLNLPI